MRRTPGARAGARLPVARVPALLLAVLLAVPLVVLLPTSPARAGSPTLRAFTTAPATVATQTAPGTLTVTIGLSDPSAVTDVGVTLQSTASPQRRVFASASLVSGSATSGTWRATGTFPVGETPGTWIVGAVSVHDPTLTQFGTAALRAAGFRTQFTVTGTADAVAPQLSSLALDRSTVDATTGPVLVHYSLHVVSGRAATTSVALLAERPGDPVYDADESEPARLTAGSPVDGTWTVDLPVPGGAAPGDWPLEVQLADSVGNYRDVLPGDLDAAGQPSAVHVITAPPVAPTGVQVTQLGWEGGSDPAATVAVSWALPPVTQPAVTDSLVGVTCGGGGDLGQYAGPATQVVVLVGVPGPTSCTVTVTSNNGAGAGPSSPPVTVALHPASQLGVSDLPTPQLASGSTIGTSAQPEALPVAVSVNRFAGPCSLVLQRSTDGGAWQGVAVPPDSSPPDVLPAPHHRYQYRARTAACGSSTATAWGYGPSFGYNVAEESNGAWSWSSDWSRVACSACSGGAQEVTSTPGATAAFETGPTTNLAVEVSTGPSGGTLAVYVDGSQVGTASTYSPSTGHRRIGLADPSVGSGSVEGPVRHLVQLVDTGAAGQSVAVDALVAV